MNEKLKELESLTSYKERKAAEWKGRQSGDGTGTGIECPNCETVEMRTYGSILSTLPPSYKIQCPKCGRVATVSV